MKMCYNQKTWTIKFFNQKVRNILLKWPESVNAKLRRTLELLEQFGPFDVGMPRIKNLGHGLFEARVHDQAGHGRALFCLHANKEIIVLHCFLKRTDRLSASDLNLALERMRECENENS